MEVVTTVEEAIEHINEYGSHHTDAVITEDEMVSKKFQREVAALEKRGVEIVSFSVRRPQDSEMPGEEMQTEAFLKDRKNSEDIDVFQDEMASPQGSIDLQNDDGQPAKQYAQSRQDAFILEKIADVDDQQHQRGSSSMATRSTLTPMVRASAWSRGAAARWRRTKKRSVRTACSFAARTAGVKVTASM